MVGLGRLSLIAAISAVSAQLQKPLPSQSEDVLGTKPLVDTDLLQARISTDSLLKHAKALYDIAASSEEEYGHPTRVIGSEGKPPPALKVHLDANQEACEWQGSPLTLT